MSRHNQGYRAKDDPMLVIICEHDIDDPLRSSGAIIMEQYTANAPDQVMDRAKMFADGGKYGRVWVGEICNLNEIPRKVKVTITEADRPD